MLSGRNVVCLSTIDWGFLWQEHQAVMSILARAGNRVLFIENMGVRTPGWRDLPRLAARLRNRLSARGRFGSIAPNIQLYSPVALPFPYSRVAQRINRIIVGRRIQSWLSRNAFTEPILFSFLPTQFLLDLMDLIEPALCVHYCTDDLAQTSVEARKIRPYEQRVLARCDLVLASAQSLVEYCRTHNPNTRYLPMGVSLEKFEAAWRGKTEMPAEMRALPRPIFGYVGGIHPSVDQELLVRVAEEFPHASIVLVGPEQTDTHRLRSRPNVHLLGARPHDLVPSYVAAFDVCLIPYRVNDFTRSVSPAKLNEYLAVGKPVVATGLPEVRCFDAENPGAIRVSRSSDEFAKLCGSVDGFDGRDRRRAIAERNSWDARVSQLCEWMEGSLSPG